MNRLLRLWQRPVVYRTAIGLYVALVLTLAGITFSVNNLDVQGAVYARGESDLEKGRSHGMRGVFQYAPTGEQRVPESMSWKLVAGDGVELPEPTLEFVRGPAVETWPNPTFQVDESVPEGTYQLQVDIGHDDLSETLTAQTEVTVGSRPEPPSAIEELRWPRHTRRIDDPGGTPVIERAEPETDESVEEQREPGEEEVQEIDFAEDDSRRRIGLHVGPPGGELSRGLTQTLVIRTYDEQTGHPVPATLEFEAAESIVEHELETPVRTNRFGFGFAEVEPATRLEMTASVRPRNDEVTRRYFETADELGDDVRWAPAEFELDFRAVATQFAVDPARRIVTVDDEVVATATGTLPDGTFMTDLYDVEGNRLLDALSIAMTDGESGVRFSAPDTSGASPLLRLQSYRSIYGTDHAWDSAYVLLLEDDSPQRLREVAVELLDWIGEAADSPHHRTIADPEAVAELSESQLRRLIEAGLLELPPTFEIPPVLMNTREADRQALEVWRRDIRGDLRWMMGITIFVGIIVVLYFVIAGIRRHRRDSELLRELTVEAVDLPDGQHRKDERLERLAVVFQGLIVLLTLVAFALGILMMVSYL